MLPVLVAADVVDWALNGSGGAGGVSGLVTWSVRGVVLTPVAASRARRISVSAVRSELAATH